MQDPPTLSILVVEDNTSDFDLLMRLVRNQPELELTRVCSVQSAVEAVSERNFDASLLDLTLHDSQGLETVERFIANAPCPVVVLSGISDESTALQSVQSGAQDYLVKGEFDAVLLRKTLRYAIERYRLLGQLEASRAAIERERSLRRLQSDTDQLSSSEAARRRSTRTLKTEQVEVFNDAVNRYRQLLQGAVEQRSFKVEHDSSESLRALATTLGRYRAIPRDVVQVHASSLGMNSGGISSRMRDLMYEESHYLLTHLLGHLCSYYLERLPERQSSESLSAPVSSIDAKTRFEEM